MKRFLAVSMVPLALAFLLTVGVFGFSPQRTQAEGAQEMTPCADTQAKVYTYGGVYCQSSGSSVWPDVFKVCAGNGNGAEAVIIKPGGEVINIPSGTCSGVAPGQARVIVV